MFEDRDLYESFYTDYLWRLLPEVYRASDSDDSDQAGPLRELVVRLGKQIAVVRRSIDRTVEDQSIVERLACLLPLREVCKVLNGVGDLVREQLRFKASLARVEQRVRFICHMTILPASHL